VERILVSLKRRGGTSSAPRGQEAQLQALERRHLEHRAGGSDDDALVTDSDEEGSDDEEEESSGPEEDRRALLCSSASAWADSLYCAQQRRRHGTRAHL
jgi:hypothetical protein